MSFGIIILFVLSTVAPTSFGQRIKSSEIIEHPSISMINNILYVGGNGPNNYTKIQDAINDANNGDMVYVYNGTYWGDIVVNKSINLIGEDRDTTYIEGSSGKDIINISVDWVNISGFTIPWGEVNVVGIYSSNNTFTENNILYGEIGIAVYSNYNIISDNNITNCHYGIILKNSVIGNSILGNNISSHEEYGIRLDSSNSNTIKDNIITSNELYGISLYNSHNNTISGNNVSWTQHCIDVGLSHYNSFIDNNFEKNNHDLKLRWSNNNTIIGNTFSDTTCCTTIRILTSNNNYISNNIIRESGFSYSIFIINNSYNNVIIGNIINHGAGIDIKDSCSYNTIINNTLSNLGCGVSIRELSFNNSIYHNNFINNTWKVYDECSNSWDDDYPSGGNFWDDYTGNDSDGDGIGDTPYPIYGGDNVDRYPLGNFRPDTPMINGPTNGNPGVDYNYTFVTSDPEGDDVWYQISWDEHLCFIYGPYPSGEEITLSHNWDEKGTYLIMCRARDIYDAVSNTTTLEVTIPRNKVVTSNMLLLRILERFPLLERLLYLFRV